MLIYTSLQCHRFPWLLYLAQAGKPKKEKKKRKRKKKPSLFSVLCPIFPTEQVHHRDVDAVCLFQTTVPYGLLNL